MKNIQNIKTKKIQRRDEDRDICIKHFQKNDITN